MIAYIAGKITGDDNYREKFALAEEELYSYESIDTVLNPATLPETLPNDAALKICLAMVEQADCIYALADWIKSEGAGIEIAYARYLGKYVMFERRS